MRTLLMFAPLLLAGCGSRYDGTWLVHFELTDSTEDPDAVGAEQDGYAYVYALTGGLTAFDMGDPVLTGTIDGKSFEFEYTLGSSYTIEGCTTSSEESMKISGDFTPDLGMEGELEYTYVAADCQEEPDGWNLRYDLTGLLLNANEGEHPQGGLAFGYFGGGGTYN